MLWDISDLSQSIDTKTPPRNSHASSVIWLVSPDGNVAPEPPINLVTPSPAKGQDNASPGSCAGSSNVPQPNGNAAAGVPARNNTVKRMLQLESPEAGTKADMAAAPSSRHDPAPTVITCLVGSIPGGATHVVAATLNSLWVPGRHFVAKRRQDTMNELVCLDHNPG